MDDDSFEMLPEDFISGRAIPPEMIRDLRVIAQIDARTVGRIGEHFSQLQGLTAKNSVKEGVQSCLQESNPDFAENIVRTLLNLKPHDIARTVKTVDSWRHSSEERHSVFTDELFAALERNLQVLVADYPSIALIRKANRLLRDVGNEFKSVAFFCDMRPVFDEPRKKVEGFVVVANMRLIYVSQNGDRHACEVALSEDELRKLIKTSEEALAKLDVLRATSAKLGQGIKK
jgi:hypothetical protein